MRKTTEVPSWKWDQASMQPCLWAEHWGPVGPNTHKMVTVKSNTYRGLQSKLLGL